MLKNFNILATTYRRSEGLARSELRFLLECADDPSALVDKTGISGVIVAQTSLDPLEAIAKLRHILQERPYEFRYLLRVIPVEMVVRTDLGEIANAVQMLSTRISKDETYRVTVEKRFTKLHSKELIEAVATRIERKVNLTRPEKILLVEILGGFTGVSIIKPDEILSVLKEKVL